MKTIQGDLVQLALQGEFDVIIHGCNCHCTMGAGIAKEVKTTFPEAYDADARTFPGDRSKLGTISYATVTRNGHVITVVNGYTQFNFKGSGVLVDYEALRAVMAAVALLFSGKRIGYPKIGSGLAHGDWSVIAPIIDEELHGEDHTLVELPPS